VLCQEGQTLCSTRLTEQAFIAAMLVGILLITLIFLLAASKIIHFIGATGTSVIGASWD